MVSLDIVKGVPVPISMWDTPAVSLSPASLCLPSAKFHADDISNTGDDFNLPAGPRKSLSSILIVHPVAALLTLICLCLAIAAHFHAPSHSPRFLLTLLILLLPTLLVTLLAFLVDILLFVPHLGWGGWIVLVATIISPLAEWSPVPCAEPL